MKYMILIWRNPESRAIFESMSEAQRGAGLRMYAELNEELSGSGELIATAALANPALAKRVTRKDAETLATDGPFAEAKEELAGFYLVDCESTERAIEIAGRIPDARLGLVEVRPTMVYSEMDM
jgi:hypothetical protein